MKNKLKLIQLATTILASSMVSHAHAADDDEFEIDFGGAIMQSWQSGMEVDGTPANLGDADSDSGFHRLRFAINVNVKITDKISVFAELAEEPNDWNSSAAAISQDLAWIQYNVSEEVGVRLGNLIATTQTFIRYSDGAAVQANPFVGNGLVDMITAEQGLWLYGVHNLQNDTSITWDAVLSTPDFFADFTDGRGYNYGLRGTLNFANGLSFGAGTFKTNHDQEAVEGLPFGSLIAIGDGDNYQFASTAVSARATHPLIVPGVDALVWQADIQYKTDDLMVHALYGNASDKFSWAGGEGSLQTSYIEEDSEMTFWLVEGQYDFGDDYYLAIRYAESQNESEGVSGPNTASRLQVGGGWWYNKSTLVKLEYVDQDEEQFSGGGAALFGAPGGAQWSGIVAEVSIVF
jgi:hypothetical protein